MSKPLGNPTDAMVANRLGEMELRIIRMTWMLEQQQAQMQMMGKVIDERDVTLAAKDAEIARLRELANEPNLPLGEANGKHVELKH